MEHFNRDSNGMITTGKAVMTEPGCTHKDCVLEHPHAGPAILRDEQGRKPVSVMTDREIAEETLATMRATQDLVTRFITDFARNPMFGTLTKMFGR